MKKLIVLLLALVVVSGAFAQLTVAGYDKAKVTYSGDPKTAAFSDEIRFNLTATDKDGNYGVSGRFQGSSSGYNPAIDQNGDGVADKSFLKDVNGDKVNLGANDFAVKYLYGWAKFFNGMVKLSAGKINEGGFQFGANEANNMGGNVNSDINGAFTDIRTKSMEVTVVPMPGLNVAMIYTPDGNTITGSNFKYLAAYSVEKLLNVKVEAAFDGNKKPYATFGAEYVGVENLSAVAGLKMATYDDLTSAAAMAAGDTLQYMGLYSIVGYTMDKLFLEGAALFDLKENVGLKDKKGYYFEGNAEYTMETFSVRGFVGYQKNCFASGTTPSGANDAAKDIYILGGKGSAYGADSEPNKYKFGAEVSFPIGSGELNAGLAYADKTKLEIPVYLKIAF